MAYSQTVNQHCVTSESNRNPSRHHVTKVPLSENTRRHRSDCTRQPESRYAGERYQQSRTNEANPREPPFLKLCISRSAIGPSQSVGYHLIRSMRFAGKAYLGDEVYPGENILDGGGNRIGSTRTLFTATNAGGRAAFALESVAAMDYLFNVKNVVVVHHSFCGTTTLTPELMVEEFHDHHHADISTLFDHDSLAIVDFEESLNYDIKLLRQSPAVPKHIKLYGLFYEISSGKLTEVVRDIPA
jgi:carbonic anhydrase